MRLKHIWTVFKKEVKDISRDKRTLLVSIVIPMLIIPLINTFVGGGISKLQKDIIENVSVALSDNSNTPEIRTFVENDIIGENPNIRLVNVEDPQNALKDDKVRLVLEIEKDFSIKIKDGKPFQIKIFYDKSKTKSQGSLSVLNDAIQQFNSKVLEQRITALGVSRDILEPTKIEESNIADETKTSTSMLAMFLPFLVVILMTVGGVPPATDLVAGEKERNTFEPLLTTKPGRASILIGKYLTVTLFSFVTVVATVFGIILGYLINPNALSIGTGQQITGFYVPPLALVLSLLIAITLGMTFAGIQIALSTYARSFKEAQVYLSFLMIAAMVPAYANMFTQPNDIPLYSFLLPVLNTISAFKIVLGGSINYFYLLLAFISSIVYVIIALAVAVLMFKREKVLFRS
jgi:sodium transport system permease protein